MKRYTLQERIEIIEIHYKNGELLAETVRKTRTFLGRREATCRTAIKNLVEKFEQMRQIIAVVAESVKENPGLSIPRRSLELGIPQTPLHRIFRKDFCLKAYRVQLTQELKPADHQQRRIFADCFRTVLSLKEVTTVGHRELVIQHLATFSFGAT